jgi:DNA modification methylase
MPQPDLIPLPVAPAGPAGPAEPARARPAELAAAGRRRALAELLAGDLDFKGQDSSYASHNFHAFAAKFPPQLPRVFIERLTAPGEVVLDPMAGSGTALLEAYLLDRRAIGCDLDPLALLQARVKTTRLDPDRLAAASMEVLAAARRHLAAITDPASWLRQRYDAASAAFIEYWFLPETQRQLLALVLAVEALADGPVRDFMQVAFSSIIVTKSGGVSRARDLAHSRPHRVLEKVPKEALAQFHARARKNLENIAQLPRRAHQPEVRPGDARALPVERDAVDLVVTSPPYANAIDYMRAHKFSLVWFGTGVRDLGALRGRYIGAERAPGETAFDLPPLAESVCARVAALDRQRGQVLRKYYHDMGAAIGEMLRTLRPGRAMVLVVGSSTMRGVDVETQRCLAELAREAGMDLVGIEARRLDRDKRMMPARFGSRQATLIEGRMHHEYVIAGMKPG